jgi:hypothetical protein
MTKLHLDVWTPDLKSFQVVLIAGGENAVTLTPTQSGWNSFDLDLATQYAGRNLTNAIQLKLERTLWTPTDGNVNSLYIDNIYFYRPATTQPPTLGDFTVPTKVAGDPDFDLTAPSSNGSGAFTFTSSNPAVATISGSTVHIVDAGSSTITATQAEAGGYSSISVIANLEVSLAAAAPTPAVPADRVLSLFSNDYTNLGGTDWRPSWGQSTQYNLENVAGNSTIKYSNLNYEGVQLSTPIDVSSYTNLHIDVYGAGTSTVDFTVINQEGVAGSNIQKIEAKTTLTLNQGVWNSFDIPLSSLTGLELNRIGQLMFVGSATIYVDNIYFSKETPSHTTAPTVANISYCKGAKAVALTATAISTNMLKWYTTAIIATALPAAPIPTTTTVGNKSYFVAQVMSDGFTSPRAEIVVSVNAILATAAGTITGATAQGALVGTETPATYSIADVANAVSYIWTVPTGVNILSGQGTTTLTVNFKDVAPATGSIGNIAVTAVNATGCGGAAKTLALTKALPKAPAAVVMTDDAAPIIIDPITQLAKKPVAIKSFAKYIGTSTELTLTATAVVGASSYDWELPAGVTKVSNRSCCWSNIFKINC